MVAAALVAAATMLSGCGRSPKKPSVGAPGPAGKPTGERVSLTLYLPCVISSPMRKVITGYTSAHPEVEVWDTVTKPMALVGKVRSEKQQQAAAVITMGDLEMDALVGAGVVARGDVRDIAVNTYPLAVVVPAEGFASVRQLSDLATPAVRRVFVENPAESTLGDRAKRALEKLGLWQRIEPKLVQFDPEKNVVDQLVSGKADAMVVFKDCLFAEGGSPAKTVRLIGELPQDSYPAITYQAAVVSAAPRPEAGRQFVDYLVSAGGQEALQRAGLTPP